LENVAWGDIQIRLHVSVLSEGNYSAEIRP
jgi:hypothetical protein